jgi:hypothetical protein
VPDLPRGVIVFGWFSVDFDRQVVGAAVCPCANAHLSGETMREVSIG